MTRWGACAATIACSGLLLGLGAAPASAGSDRMRLACEDGRVIERANGSSWWGVNHDAGYVTEHLRIASQDEVLFEKDYGRRGPDADRSTCVADHFGASWTVELVRAR